MNNIEKIRQEIERLKGQLIRGACAAQIEMETNCKEEAYDEILSFLSTLESEKPIDGLEEEIERYLHSLGVGYGGWIDGMDDDDLRGIARHFAQWGAEHAREQMMKDAIHYVVQDDLDSHGASYNIPFIRIGIAALKPKGIGVGDKVRVIIVKED